MEDFLIFSCSNRVDFFLFSIIKSRLPQVGISLSNRIFSLKRVIRWRFVLSWTYRAILMPRHVSHIHNIRLNRQCGMFHDCERFGKPIFCGAVKMPAGRSTLMRRCVADSGFFLTLAVGFWGTPASPPNSPWRTMRTGAWPRRRSATEALPNQSMSLARPASGGLRRPPGQARRPSRPR
jgi:hypothetical protein